MIKELMPLSIGQKGVAYLRQRYPSSPVNNIGGVLLLEDNLDFDLMQKTINICVQRNDALRLQLSHRKKSLLDFEVVLKEKIMQYISDEKTVQLGYRDFRGSTMQEMYDQISVMNSTLLPVYDSPLYEFTFIKSPDGRQGIFVKLDHHITDAWNSALLCREVIEIYYSLLRGEELPKPLNQFQSYLEREKSYVRSAQYRKDKEFWMSRYKTRPGITRFRQTKNQSTTGFTKRLNFNTSREKTEEINNFCNQNNISVISLFTMLISLCLSRFNNNPEAIISTPVMLRSTVSEKNICGALVNLLQIRTSFDENKTFIATLHEINDERLASMRHLRYPYLHLMTDIYRKYHLTDFKDTMLSFPTAHIDTREKVNFETKWIPSTAFPNPLSMYVSDIDNTGEYKIHYEYHTDTFDPEVILGIHSDLMSCLQKGLDRPEIRIGDL